MWVTLCVVAKPRVLQRFCRTAVLHPPKLINLGLRYPLRIVQAWARGTAAVRLKVSIIFFTDVHLINILAAVLHSTYSPSFFTYLLKLQCASLPQYAKGVPPYTTEVKHLDTVWCNITFLFAHPKINSWSFHASFFYA